jgi:predicted RNA-binding Zn-ribbon protein involved in translation (DUF1610 family)
MRFSFGRTYTPADVSMGLRLQAPNTIRAVASDMSLVDSLKEMLVPDTEPGVVYECAECGERFDDARAHCSNCGSNEIKEQEGFDFRP